MITITIVKFPVIPDYGTKHEFQYIKTMAYSCNHSGKKFEAN